MCLWLLEVIWSYVYFFVGGWRKHKAEGIKWESGWGVSSSKSITKLCWAEKVPSPISCFISKWKCDYRDSLPGNVTSSPITHSHQERVCTVCEKTQHNVAACQIVPLISLSFYYFFKKIMCMCVSLSVRCFIFLLKIPSKFKGKCKHIGYFFASHTCSFLSVSDYFLRRIAIYMTLHFHCCFEVFLSACFASPHVRLGVYLCVCVWVWQHVCMYYFLIYLFCGTAPTLFAGITDG